MRAKRNLTLRLDSEVIRKARILAAQGSISVSRLVAEELERLVGEPDRYLASQETSLADPSTGFRMGEGPFPTRDSLHER